MAHLDPAFQSACLAYSQVDNQPGPKKKDLQTTRS